jgi:hypothetical protein
MPDTGRRLQGGRDPGIGRDALFGSSIEKAPPVLLKVLIALEKVAHGKSGDFSTRQVR